MADLHDLTIEMGQAGRESTVLIDGRLLKGVVSVSARTSVDEVTRVTIELLCSVNKTPSR